ncbi:Ku protein [Xanthobacter tagetidis]|uniref:Non-homologous end joining protein Ku n=1 Tax=Xanthobacter tagetidis TaxID=60216 RepID=A0A3L7AJD0_9HYPH|nr:Ku protein [Xanthobacter tagetidis]MBB6306778.1 DNA end-binding protein Ku [Xanthobacter tagetidis]RLP80144.1 Ku protein [Xanthobacter tagetidis]
MAPRAQWKGVLRIGAFTCPVALFTAVSTSERIAFHTLNRATGHRVKREFVDSVTGKPVPAEDQVKGYETADGRTVTLEPEEVAAAVPESDKTLDVTGFLPCDQIDEIYLDRSYYLAPADAGAETAFVALREGLRKAKAAALAHAVLFRRFRVILVRPQDEGLVATLLNFDYEVRSARAAFADVPQVKTKGEMLDLARHIIDTKRGTFDPAGFEDRYEAALAELVKAKQAGKPLKPARKAAGGKVIDLMDALRRSAGTAGGTPSAKAPKKAPARSAKAKGAKEAPAKAPAAKSRRKAG